MRNLFIRRRFAALIMRDIKTNEQRRYGSAAAVLVVALEGDAGGITALEE
jgi:hypothetical protein